MEMNELKLSLVESDIPTVKDPESDAIVEINIDGENTTTTGDVASNKEGEEMR